MLWLHEISDVGVCAPLPTDRFPNHCHCNKCYESRLVQSHFTRLWFCQQSNPGKIDCKDPSECLMKARLGPDGDKPAFCNPRALRTEGRQAC